MKSLSDQSAKVVRLTWHLGGHVVHLIGHHVRWWGRLEVWVAARALTRVWGHALDGVHVAHAVIHTVVHHLGGAILLNHLSLVDKCLRRIELVSVGHHVGAVSGMHLHANHGSLVIHGVVGWLL